MTDALSTVVAELSTPGRFLAFCTETDLTKESTSSMLADIHLHPAVVGRCRELSNVAAWGNGHRRLKSKTCLAPEGGTLSSGATNFGLSATGVDRRF